jgi:hypothetical protein
MSSSSTTAAFSRELDLADLVRRSWDLFAKKPLENILCTAVVLALSGLTLGLLAAPLHVTYVRVIDRQRRGEPVAVEQLFAFEGTGFTAFATAVLMALGIAAGFCFLVLPGLVLALGWFYALWFVALTGQPAMESMAAAWRLFRGNVGSVLVVVLVLLVLSSAGAAALLGWLITFPLGMIFATLAFTDLRRA